MLLLKIILIVSFLVVFFQDFKKRLVYWFLFPIIGISSGTLFYNQTLPELFYITLAMNLLFLLSLVFIVFLYARFKLNTLFFNTMGWGDLLLFLALSVSFSTISFIVLFTSALVFALLLHLLFSKNNRDITVPLAGYMSLFFLSVYLAQWFGNVTILYTM